MIAQYAHYAMAAVLIAAMFIEVRTGRIPNWLTALPFVIFIAVFATNDDRWAMMTQVYMAIGIFVFGLILFAIAGIGAGAVKLMTGTALFIPLNEAFPTLLIFVLAFFVVSGVVVQVRKLIGSEDSKWHIWRAAILPMSLPIGLAGLGSMFGL